MQIDAELEIKSATQRNKYMLGQRKLRDATWEPRTADMLLTRACLRITGDTAPAQAHLRVCSVTTFMRLEDARCWAYGDCDLSSSTCHAVRAATF